MPAEARPPTSFLKLDIQVVGAANFWCGIYGRVVHRLSFFFLLFCAVVAAEAPLAVAERHLRTITEADGAYVAKTYTTAHNGVTHFVFRQRFDGVDVINAVVKINVDRDGRVINSGGSLYKRPPGPAPSVLDGSRALRAAVRDVNPSIDGSYLSGGSKGDGYTRFARGGIGNEMEGRPVWFAVAGTVRPAWLFYVPGENGADRFATIVDAERLRVIGKRNLTRYQSPAPARGLVFERESPQPNPTPGTINTRRPYVQRTLQPFTGDPIASPRGWVDGTETRGNNVIAGRNATGQFQTLTPITTVAPDRNFSFPLELGPGAPNPTTYPDAATTNLFYWANRAHDLFYRIGFDEAAGNFQQDNFGKGGVGGDPMLSYSQFGIAAPRIASMDNAFYTANRAFEDGSRPSINMFLAGSFQDRLFSDGSYDNEVIVHEYTHGVTDRLGEDVYDTHQGGAMAEAWSDFYALEFTLPPGAPLDGSYTVGEYLTQDFGTGIRTRPYSTDMSVNPLTFRDYARVSGFGPEVHSDGEIWMLALWEARANLIRQFGEPEGRRRMSILVLDGLKLQPPRASMVDARDAILLADRVGFRGESQNQLWAAFAKRGLGAAAHTASGNSSTVTAGFEVPSNRAIVRFEHPDYVMGETLRLIVHDANNTGSTALVQLTSSFGRRGERGASPARGVVLRHCKHRRRRRAGQVRQLDRRAAGGLHQRVSCGCEHGLGIATGRDNCAGWAAVYVPFAAAGTAVHLGAGAHALQCERRAAASGLCAPDAAVRLPVFRTILPVCMGGGRRAHLVRFAGVLAVQQPVRCGRCTDDRSDVDGTGLWRRRSTERERVLQQQ